MTTRAKNGGRKKGTPNKVTTDFKEALNRLLNESAPHFQEWLDAVSAEKRLEVICRLAEFCHAKLGRQELSGPEGGPVVVEVVKYGAPS